MNDRQFNEKVLQDAHKVKKDIGILVGDSSIQFGRLEDNFRQTTGKAKEDLTTWVEGSVSKVSEGFGRMTDNVRETVDDTAASVKKEVGHGLSQYNKKVKEVVDKVPGNLNAKAARYPWVAISIALAFGFMLGSMLRPSQKYQ